MVEQSFHFFGIVFGSLACECMIVYFTFDHVSHWRMFVHMDSLALVCAVAFTACRSCQRDRNNYLAAYIRQLSRRKGNPSELIYICVVGRPSSFESEVVNSA